MSLADGQVIDGKYVIVRRIANGGMSTVYLGTHQRLGKDVAVKVLSAAMANAEDVVERFEREARVVSRIRSPYVADVYDFGALETGERFMVMEYLEGESLAAMLERDRTPPVMTLMAIASQILQGLAAAHAAGVVHRDLKPDNVIVAKDARVVKLVDFGISKVMGAANASIPPVRATQAGAVLGTPLYMSPEQARGTTNLVDQRTDLYALGVILYEAIAGVPPLTGENVNDLLFRVALDEPTPLEERVPTVDRGLAAIVAKAMAKDVTARYQTAEEMLEAIAAWRVEVESQSDASTLRPTVRAVSLLPLEARTTGTYTKLRRYALAVPALAVLIFLLPIARRAVSRPADRSPPALAAEPALISGVEPVMPTTKLVPIISVEPAVTLEPPKPAPVVRRWSPPRPRKAYAAVTLDAGAAEPMVVVEPVATTPEPAPAEEPEEPTQE